MTQGQIRAEIYGLNTFLEDKRNNLPEIAFENDASVQAVIHRISHLNKELDIAIEKDNKTLLLEKERINDESKSLDMVIDKLMLVVDELKGLAGQSIIGRRNEIVDAILHITRR